MNTVKRYLKENEGDGLTMVWVVVSGEDTIVATGFDSRYAPFEIEDPLTSVPEGWAEIDEAAFTAEQTARRQAELDAMDARNLEVQEREGVLQNLINGADDLLGGIL